MRLTEPAVACRHLPAVLPILLPVFLLLLLTTPVLTTPALAAGERTYVGTDACAPCHADQHATFRKYAKKSKSAHSVKVMSSKLTREEVQGCYACHTTGYGRPGGFVSFEATPHLADAGCEVCHGPGSAHVDSGGDVALIDKPTMEGCVVCHNEQRVRSFNFKPLLHGGAH
ncbi:cytochrome c family protein [Nitratidesulfovibrio sp. 1201_IL3209]|uniref:cytochrome c family protein n=1 Tax=Nitratidesulfovibrio sp. 1201_IL3209 TaxID=3084053 RepID=UPI002FDB7574